MKHTKTPKNVQHTSIGRTVPKEFIKTEFTKLVSKGDSGGNDYVADFLLAMDELCAVKGSFTVEDCFYYAKRLSIPSLETKRLFERWTDFMLGWHKVSIVENVYDDKLVILS